MCFKEHLANVLIHECSLNCIFFVIRRLNEHANTMGMLFLNLEILKHTLKKHVKLNRMFLVSLEV